MVLTFDGPEGGAVGDQENYERQDESNDQGEQRVGFLLPRRRVGSVRDALLEPFLEGALNHAEDEQLPKQRTGETRRLQTTIPLLPQKKQQGKQCWYGKTPHQYVAAGSVLRDNFIFTVNWSMII